MSRKIAAMNHLLVLFMVGVGMLVPIQAGVNAEFRRHAGHPLWAGVLNFAVGLVALIAITTVLRLQWPAATKVTQAPWWAFIGGMIGATMVVSSVVSAPRLGAATLVAALLCGQLCCSLLLDHFGWVGYPERGLSGSRVAGVALLVAGVWLIQRG